VIDVSNPGRFLDHSLFLLLFFPFRFHFSSPLSPFSFTFDRVFHPNYAAVQQRLEIEINPINLGMAEECGAIFWLIGFLSISRHGVRIATKCGQTSIPFSK
jgi:hypothetical protein